MHNSLRLKLDNILERYDELNALLADNTVAQNPELLRKYNQELAQITPIVEEFGNLKKLEAEKIDLEDLAQDPEMKDFVKEELPKNEEAILNSEQQLQKLMIPKDPLDGANVYLEIRAGTGGDEAAIFAGDLFRMYGRFAELRGWKMELMSENLGEMGGYKEVIAKINGENVYSTLKYESGAHRVQRIPLTETNGRVHTSAATVAILPEVEEISEIDINPADLRIDTYRASGAGGQHINKTDSAVRILHIPTGLIVECQEERSQHKNKSKAMKLLQARLLKAQQDEQNANIAAERKSLVGSGDRSERIRTYNFPQNRLTDHRINLTLYALTEIMEGDLNQVVLPLQQEQEARALLELNEQLAISN